MKKIITFVFALSLLYSNICYSQSGWFWQNPLPQGINFSKIDFLNSTTCFAWGSGYLIKSIDAGNNWFCISNSTGTSLSDLDFIDQSTGFFTGRYSKIQKTTNGGKNWIIMFDYPYWQPSPKIYFLNEYIGFAGVGYNVWDNLFRTSDGGNSWLHPTIEYTSVSDITSIHFVNNYIGYATIYLYYVIKTTDQGLTWSAQYIGWPNYFTSSYFTDANTGYLVGGVYEQLWERIHKTTNGGLNWFLQTAPNRKANFRDIEFADANTGMIVGDSGIIVKTTNAGMNWNVLNQGLNISLQSLNFLDINTAFIIGYQGSILKTTNQGINFISINYRINDTLNSVFFSDSLTGYAVGNNGLIMKDSCGFWFKIYSEQGKQFTSVCFNNNSTGYCTGNSGVVLKTTNGGLSWSVYQCNTISKLNSIKFLNSVTGYVTGDSGKIFKTTNSGLTWFGLTSGTGLNLNKITVFNSNHAMIVGDNGVFLKTTNSGLNWVQYSTNVIKRLNSIFVLNDSIHFAVGDSSTFIKSTNGGINWLPLTLPTVTYNLNDVIFMNTNIGYIAGDGGKILKTTNAGVNWGFQYNGVNEDLNELSFINLNTGYVVGSNGVIRKTTNGGGPAGITQIGTEIPLFPSLFQNYPNPFNPVTKIKYDIPPSKGVRGMIVKLIVYDILGRAIETLVNETQKPGSYEVTWDGSRFASGVYFYRLVTDDFTETKKMVLIK